MNIRGEKKNILIVLPALPHPLRSDGRSVRYLPIIRCLADNHNVDLLVISEEKPSVVSLRALSTICRRVVEIRVPSPEQFGILRKGLTWIMGSMPWSPPYLYVKHGGEVISRQIIENLKGSHYDVLLWGTVEYTPYLLEVMKGLEAKRVIVDFIDSPTLWAKRVHERRGILSLDSWYKYWKMVRWEGKVSRKASAVMYISPIDAAAVPTMYTDGIERHVVNNGINVENYLDTQMAEIPRPNIGFLGNMGYGPNIEAVAWLYERVYVPLKKEMPGLSLLITGRNPDPSVIEMGRKEGVIVTGEVDDIWPYVNSVDLFLFPIWMGTGIKNKVIEAMFAGRPVITTPVGNDGINGEHGTHLMICNSEEEFIRESLTLIRSEERRRLLGQRGHTHVVESFSWESKLEEFKRILFPEVTKNNG